MSKKLKATGKQTLRPCDVYKGPPRGIHASVCFALNALITTDACAVHIVKSRLHTITGAATTRI